MDKRRVYYVCFYAEKEIKDKVICYPSVWSKIDYIVSCMLRNDMEVCQLCLAPPLYEGMSAKKIKVNDNYTRYYLKTRYSKNLFLKKIYMFAYQFSIVLFLLKNLKKNDVVLVYHSLYHKYWLRVLNKIFCIDYYLEIEDVFSELNSENKKFSLMEWNMFKKSKGCICINDIVFSKCENSNKIVSYGAYNAIPDKSNKKNKNKIRLVYAGVIESVRNAAFLAVNTMRLLPDNYELYVLGFGNNHDLKSLKNLIEDVNAEKGNNTVKFLGSKTGDEYYKILQECDIALSTHSYSEENMGSANNTFPSKVLVYLSNNLRVVAQRLDCLSKSRINNFITYYDSPNEESLCNAILSINVLEPFESRTFIQNMDKEFCENLNNFFNK